jgi:hypothetical protein
MSFNKIARCTAFLVLACGLLSNTAQANTPPPALPQANSAATHHPIHINGLNDVTVNKDGSLTQKAGQTVYSKHIV